MTNKLSLLFALMLSTLMASAHDIEVKNAYGVTIYYNIISDKELAVTFKGKSGSSYDCEYGGVVVIPENVIYNDKTYDVTSIGKSAFDNCTGLTSVTIGNKVRSIGKDAFEDCSGLKHVVIGSSVTYIGAEAFKATGISTIDIPNSVTGIGKSAFQDCANLISFTFPNSITSIEEGILTDCINLNTVIIPKSVTTIDEQLLKNCSSLREVYCYAENVPFTNTRAFENSNVGNAILYVPETSMGAYNTTVPWNQFGIIMALEDIKPATVRGDVNGDGKVDMDDVTLIVNYILGNPDDTFDAEAADANQDGEIGIPDIMFIINHNLNGKFPDEEEHSYLTCPDDKHPHMIDLGLPSGTKWACCNVGTNAPEGYGNYYAWGETQPKSYYSWETYQYGRSSSDVDSIGSDIAGTQYDAATANWGVSWQMPSYAQINELLSSCTSNWTTINGVNGREFTGTNGGTIFVPAAGYR